MFEKRKAKKALEKLLMNGPSNTKILNAERRAETESGEWFAYHVDCVEVAVENGDVNGDTVTLTIRVRAEILGSTMAERLPEYGTVGRFDVKPFSEFHENPTNAKFTSCYREAQSYFGYLYEDLHRVVCPPYCEDSAHDAYRSLAGDIRRMLDEEILPAATDGAKALCSMA